MLLRGEYLGIVGSSGYSTNPHLHFEVYDATDNLIDPFSGECNTLNSEIWWQEQPDYYVPYCNKLMTCDAVPEFPDCPERAIINEQNEFCPGDKVFYLGYFRDLINGQKIDYKVLRPNLSEWKNWTYTVDFEFANAYYIWHGYTLPVNAEKGQWSFQIFMNDFMFEHHFYGKMWCGLWNGMSGKIVAKYMAGRCL